MIYENIEMKETDFLSTRFCSAVQWCLKLSSLKIGFDYKEEDFVAEAGVENFEIEGKG